MEVFIIFRPVEKQLSSWKDDFSQDENHQIWTLRITRKMKQTSHHVPPLFWWRSHLHARPQQLFFDNLAYHDIFMNLISQTNNSCVWTFMDFWGRKGDWKKTWGIDPGLTKIIFHEYRCWSYFRGPKSENQCTFYIWIAFFVFCLIFTFQSVHQGMTRL